MDHDSPIFRDLIRFRPEGLSLNAWAVKAGVSRTVWADMRRHGNPSRRTLEKLLTAAGSSLAEFEALRIHSPDAPPPQAGPASTLSESPAWRWIPAALPPLSLYHAGLAGEWPEAGSGIELLELEERIVDRVARPASLASDKEAYAIPVVGEAMVPRFRPGARIAVAPAANCVPGDDVLVVLAGPREASATGAKRILVKQLAGRAAAYLELRQHNPETTFRLDSEQVTAVHKVMGELF